MDNKRYYIELEVLTPLSVGAGSENDWICGVDYVIKDGKVYVIDMERAARLGIDVERLASAFAQSDQRAIINLMGSAGGVCALVLGLGFLFNTGAIKNTFMSYIGFFGAIIIIMLIALVVFMVTVKEPEWAAEMEEKSRELGIDDVDDNEAASGDKKLSKGEKVSLLLILASVILWYMGYNAVTSKYSIYAGRVLDKDYNLTDRKSVV